MLPAFPKPKPESSLEYLAAVRGWAALVVLFSHAAQIFGLPFWGLQSWPHRISSTASEYAVVVFFLLSGFLIAHSMEQNRNRNRRPQLIEFLAARFARIYPPLIFAVLLSVVIFAVFSWLSLPGVSSPYMRAGDVYSAREVITLTRSEVLSALLLKSGMLSINGPLWSLYIEIKLYVLFGCAYCLFRGSTKISSRVVAAALFVAVGVSGLKYNPEFLYYSVIWLLGCLAYYLWRRKRNGPQNFELSFCVVAIATCACAGMVMARLGSAAPTSWTDATKWVELILAAVLACLLFRRPFSIPAGSRIAPWSYSLYVVHFPVLLIFQAGLIAWNVTAAHWVVTVSCAGCLAAVAVAMLGGIVERQKERVQDSLLVIRAKAMQGFSLAWARNE